MRTATLLICLSLTACSGFRLPGEPFAPDIAIAPAATGALATPAAPAPSTTAIAGPVVPAATPPPALSGPERLQQARVDCWAKVERQKSIRDIDRRIAFVDKCVTDDIKDQP